MTEEIWIVHCLDSGTGRALIGVASSLTNVHQVNRDLLAELDIDDTSGYVLTGRKVQKMNAKVIDLT